ncbi:MAG: D-alanyl-D-alanine carboxypeptidase [Rickettsiales bacterium]|nr:D-alanyl-D-alanine carboxypeptidase [Rickettsiales bacterium]
MLGFPALAADPELKAPYAILVDYDSGKVLYEKNANVAVPPSSMSKILTVYRIFELLRDGAYTLDSEFTVGPEAWKKAKSMNASSGSTMFLESGERVRLEDLIRGIIVNSGNDATVVAAENISGSEAAFVSDLNALAGRLGLKSAVVSNASGWYDKEHLMSARDLASLSSAIIADFPQYYHYFAEKEFLYKKDLTGNKDNRNKLLWIMPESDGLKTGHTAQFGYGLAASAKRGERRLVSVVNGLKDANGNFGRFSESKALLEWGFREFSNLVYFDDGAKALDVPVWFGARSSVPAGASRKVVITNRRGAAADVELRATYDSPAPAPVSRGDRLGRLELYIDGARAAEYDLVALEDVRRSNFFVRIFQNMKQIILRMVG